MRRAWVIAAMLLLGVASDAHADFFVPHDPAPRTADCAAAAGDLVVAARENERRGAVAELSEGGGPWRRLVRIEGLEGCPRVAAAADGTAVITVSDRMFARQPGGSFQALGMGREVVASEVAAAPGGWAAVVGDRVNALGNGTEVVATVVAPNGTSWSAVVDRGRATRRAYQEFLAPHVGVDAQGRATAAWTRWHSASGRYVLRTASTVDGRTWTRARTLAATARRTTISPGDGQVDVAVAPSGRTLLAWADGRGVHAAVDGGPVERLTAAPSAGSPTASIAGDGAALVAYSDRRSRVLADERGRDGRWAATRVLAGEDDGPLGHSEGGGPQQTGLESVIAHDGRAVVAWSGYDEFAGRIFATSGVAGSWAAVTPLSVPTREADQVVLSLGTGGEPRVLWLESLSFETHRPRGARLVSDATLRDVTAPVVTARLPGLTGPTRSGRVAFRIPVSCSETCDVRLSLRSMRDGIELASRLRELADGQTATLRVRTPKYLARELRQRRQPRRAWLDLFVSDRAGNVTRLARRVNYRIR